jgi:serine/threonine-protein kinase
MVLTGSRDDATTAVTQITRRARPGPVYEPAGSRRRAAWPWLLGVGVLLAALVAGWLLWDPIQDQLGGSDTVAVPYVEGLAQANAEAQIREEGLIPQVNRVPNSDVEEGLVFSQSPDEGTRVEPETVVRINVSSGKPEVTVPSVVGQTESDAVAELTRVGLDAQIVQVNSPEEPGRVTGQFPSAGTVVVEGTRVRINVSKGPRPVTVPSVVDLPFDQAAAELRGAGFDVSRIDVASDLARGIVVSQDPDGGSEASRGSTVTLSVSQGPTTAAVPDVTGTDVAIAQNTLEAAGFRTRVVLEDTDDPASDGIVISQDPAGSSQAELDSIVTLFVGRFVGTTDGGETTTTIP